MAKKLHVAIYNEGTVREGQEVSQIQLERHSWGHMAATDWHVQSGTADELRRFADVTDKFNDDDGPHYSPYRAHLAASLRGAARQDAIAEAYRAQEA